MMHRLLARQVHNATAETGNLDLDQLLDMVGLVYEEEDRERQRTDRSITLMIEEVEEANAELRENENLRFRAAIDNMKQGFCLYDAQANLVVCNESFARLYDLPPEMCVAGTSFYDIIDRSAQSGMVTVADATERRAYLEKTIAESRPLHEPLTMINGQIMQVTHQPMPDGGWLSTHENVTEQRQRDNLIRHLARHDGLTGLANRTTFLEVMAAAEQDIADNQLMSVLCLDIDHFKPINDTLGHAVGDAVLKETAERIKRHTGRLGIAARLGGDEFAVLLGPLANAGQAADIGRKILAAIAEPILAEERQVSVTGSMGIALAPRDGHNSDSLMRNGDLALYRAKQSNRGSLYFFEREMDDIQKRRQAVALGLKEAVEEDRLQLYYQPLICLRKNRISGCEALMRWTSPTLGVVSPAEFIPVAEETGLIREIGRKALIEACHAALDWPSHVRVAVNLSPAQFNNNDLVEQVKSALALSGLTPERLELEITESLLLTENDANLAVLHELKSLGARICMDDFGTGYSSLSYLRSFPFDKIKIDRSFLQSDALAVDNLVIIKAVIDLCKSFGMTTTTEGVETEEQFEAVRSRGCNEVQGYLFSPPLPLSGVTALLAGGLPLGASTINLERMTG